jgi:hypothetical protein
MNEGRRRMNYNPTDSELMRRIKRACLAIGLSHFKCACGQEIWGLETRIKYCAKCSGVFIKQPADRS